MKDRQINYDSTSYKNIKYKDKWKSKVILSIILAIVFFIMFIISISLVFFVDRTSKSYIMAALISIAGETFSGGLIGYTVVMRRYFNEKEIEIESELSCISKDNQ